MIILIFILVRFASSLLFSWWVVIINVLRKDNEKIKSLCSELNLCFIIRVYQEEALMKETIDYWKNVIGESQNIQLIISGTERERNSELLNPTLEIAKKHCFGDSRFRVIETPSTNSSPHAIQTNFAAKSINLNPKNTWVYFLDIDSRLCHKSYNDLISSVNSGKRIIQLHSLFLSNFSSVSFGAKSIAIYQSRWTMSHEMKRIFLYNLTKLQVAHTVGHGLCINLEEFRELGMIPENTFADDLSFGFNIIARNKKIYSIYTSFELGDNPVNLKDCIRQKEMWSIGAREYIKYPINFKKRFPVDFRNDALRILWLGISGFFGYLVWLISTPLFLLLLVIAFQGNHLALVVLFIYYLDYLSAVIFFSSKKMIDKNFVFVSPIINLIKLVLGHKSKRFKTPHY